MAVDAKLVKELRNKTGVGIGQCKKALIEADGDLERAAEILKEYGSKVAQKKSDREAKEGKTGVYISDNKVVLLEVNCETDFVSINENFQALLDVLGNGALASDAKTLEEFNNVKLSNGNSVAEELNEAIGRLKENMKIKKFVSIDYDSSTSIVGHYVHLNGKVSSVAIIDSEGDNSDEVKQAAKDIAVQVAALPFEKIAKDDYTEEDIEAIKTEILKDPAFNGKPEKVQNIILNNKLNDYFKENTLLEQEMIKYPDETGALLLSRVGKKAGKTLKVVTVNKLVLGE